MGIWGAGGTTGDDLNTGVMGPIDSGLAGLSSFSLSSSNVSLTFAAGGGGDVQNAMWRFTGTLLTDITVSPTAGDATTYFNGVYAWENVTAGNFSVTVQNGSGSVVLPQGRRGILYVNTTNSIAPRIVAIAGSSVADPIPAGTVMIFYQASVPTGWSAFAANDYAMKIVSNGSGGVPSGSVAYSTLFGRTATDGHTLTTAEIPSHQHSSGPYLWGTGFASVVLSGGSTIVPIAVSANQNTNAAGGGDAHSHSLDMRVQTAAVILGSKS